MYSVRIKLSMTLSAYCQSMIRQPYCPVNDTKGGWWNKHKDHIFEMFIKDAEECKVPNI